uniref:Dynein light chain roadblock-type 2 n=1 Tax=Oncorhynchus kisutch TaxID=8019 RepID=A0A8C7J9N4_ONCKI
MAEVEETLKRIQTHKGVIGTIVVNAEGIPIRTTLDNSTTVQYAGLLHQLTMKARSTVRDLDPQNDLTFLRIRSKKHEIMVAPDKEYLLIVIQVQFNRELEEQLGVLFSLVFHQFSQKSVFLQNRPGNEAVLTQGIAVDSHRVILIPSSLNTGGYNLWNVKTGICSKNFVKVHGCQQMHTK